MAISLVEATEQGMSRHVLRGKGWQRIGSKIYKRAEAPDDKWLELTAWQRSLPVESVFCGTTAAWMLGPGFEPTEPVQVAMPPRSGTRSRAGLRARRCVLLAEEMVVVRGLRATNLKRTLLDLCIQLTPCEALVGIDVALRRRKIGRVELAGYAVEVAGLPGSARLRELVGIAEPADSPMETRLRWLLRDRYLPRPEVQRNLYDDAGHLVGRADLYYASGRLVVEFDGGNHNERLVADDRRQNRIINAGYRILRFTSADLRDRPEAIVAQVRGGSYFGAAIGANAGGPGMDGTGVVVGSFRRAASWSLAASIVCSAVAESFAFMNTGCP